MLEKEKGGEAERTHLRCRERRGKAAFTGRGNGGSSRDTQEMMCGKRKDRR